MALPKRTTSWPISGGLDTKESPLSIQPGSFLTLDDVTQPRKGEYRRRNGFTQSAAENNATSLGPFVASVGATGLFESNWRAAAIRIPSSVGWSFESQRGVLADDMARFPIAQSATSQVAFASNGSLAISGFAEFNSGIATINYFITDLSSGVTTTQATTSIAGGAQCLRIRAAATSSFLCLFYADSSGNMGSISYATSTGNFVFTANVKTGLHATQPYLDAMFYTGSTVTVIARSVTDTTLYMEFDPSTSTLTTNTTVAAVSCSSCLSLMPEPSGSGTRIVCASHSTPTTRVVRVNSAGAISTNDQAEAILATQITGCANTAGAEWDVIYQTASGLRYAHKVGGVVSGINFFGNGTAQPSVMTIDSQAWAESGENTWHVIIGAHSTDITDPQDTWIHVNAPFGGAGIYCSQGPIVPLQASEFIVNASQLFQVNRTTTRTFAMALPVLSHYTNDGGTVTRTFSIDLFKQTMLSIAEANLTNTGRPVSYKQTAFIPTSSLRFIDGATNQAQLGVCAPPKAPTVTPGIGGSLTANSTYLYRWVIFSSDIDGNLWRSPPSVQRTAVLTGGQNQNTVNMVPWQSETPSPFLNYVAALYRTNANNSQYRRITSIRCNLYSTLTFVDTLADAAIVNGELLYTPAETSTVITPPARHVAIFGDRLWLVNRDFSTELWPSKNLRPGRQPEFCNENVIDVDDQYGDFTGIVGMDQNLTAFKQSAIYFVTGDGLSDSGSGSIHAATQICKDSGAIPGSPLCSTGDAVYYVSTLGIMSVDRSANVSFVGNPVDQYINQPEVQTPETVYDSCFVSTLNEVRFVTTNYVLVFSRTFKTWTRFNLSGFRRCLVVNDKMILFRNDGTVWREGTNATLDDQGVGFVGKVRSPWIRPAQIDGTTSQQGMRLYSGKVTYTRTAGGSSQTLIGKIYLNNDDSQVQAFTSNSVSGATLSATGEMKPGAVIGQKCTSFSIELDLPTGDTTLRLDGFEATYAIRNNGSARLPNGNRWA